MKKFSLVTVVLSALFLLGCGGGSSDSESKLTPKNILLGKTLYSIDTDLDDPRGYYKDVYGENTLTETEYTEDGTVIYEDYVVSIRYDTDSITISYGNKSIICGVKSVNKGVEFTCGNPFGKVMQWYRIEDIVR